MNANPAWVIFALAICLCRCATPNGISHTHDHSPKAETTSRAPQYGPGGELQRPTDIDTWVFLGTSLNMASADKAAHPHQHLMNNVFIEPLAYSTFRNTGEFPEGTMTAILIYSARADGAQAPGGLLPDKLQAFEMSVKDSRRFPKTGWAFYNFGPDGYSAQPQPQDTCYHCHKEHAETELVFGQYYPVLKHSASAK